VQCFVTLNIAVACKAGKFVLNEWDGDDPHDAPADTVVCDPLQLTWNIVPAQYAGCPGDHLKLVVTL
jgi:hypothetical protein